MGKSKITGIARKLPPFGSAEPHKATATRSPDIGPIVDHGSLSAVGADSSHRALVRNSSEIMLVLETGGIVQFANPAVRMLGYTAEDLLGRSCLDLIHDEDLPAVSREMAAVLDQQGDMRVLECRLRVQDGFSWRWMEVCFAALLDQRPGVGLVVANLHDITDRKRAERLEGALQKEEKESEIIFHSAPYMIWYKDTLNRIQRANRPAAHSIGMEPSAVEGQSMYDLFPSEAVRYHQDDLEVIRTGEPKLGIIQPYRVPSGEVRLLRTDKIPNRDSSGKIIGVVEFSTDITERQRSEDAMRRSEVNYRSVVQGAPYGICRVTEHGRLLDVNPALIRMLGYDSEEELLEANLDRDIFREPGARAAISKEHGEVFEGAEVRWNRKGGVAIQVRLSGRPVIDPEWPSTCYELIAEDVTERRALEQQLRQAQKMEAIGRLAGGVAHDFNNLLMVIQGHTELLIDRARSQGTAGDDWYFRKIEQVQKAAERAARLTRQLLAFSRMQVLQPKVITLNEIVSEMGKMLPRLIGEDIELEMDVAPRLGLVKADPGQMEQVVLNLAVNARDAMPNGGKLLIKTSDAEVGETFARLRPPMVAGAYVLLTVSDTGIGMDAETQAHIFEPFFTTKEVGKGTGLGLATVYGVVKQSGGFIWVSSEKGRGTICTVYLPRVEQVQESPVPSVTEAAAPPGSETVLLAEDEKEVREIAREFLSLAGYTVLEAPDGAAAIEIARRHPGPIHLLITDMIMPKVGGRELAAMMSQLRPDTKIIYMSGYAEHISTAQATLDDQSVVLTKPFTRDGLTKTANEILHAAPRSSSRDISQITKIR